MSDDTPTSSESDSQTAYASALEELEDILDEIEGASVDVDTLAERVRRASELVALCRGRLDVVRTDVASVVEDLARQTSQDDSATA